MESERHIIEVVFALTGKASEAVQMITAGITSLAVNRSNTWLPFWLSHLATAYAELGQFEDAWRCIGEAMTALETTNERWFEADVLRMAGEIPLKSPDRMRRKRKRISSARSGLHVGSRQSPGNYARQ